MINRRRPPRAVPAGSRPPLVADLAESHGVNKQTLRKALQGLPPYDYGEPRSRYERARDERDQAGRRVPLAQAASSQVKRAPAAVVGAGRPLGRPVGPGELTSANANAARVVLEGPPGK